MNLDAKTKLLDQECAALGVRGATANMCRGWEIVQLREDHRRVRPCGVRLGSVLTRLRKAEEHLRASAAHIAGDLEDHTDTGREVESMKSDLV